MQTLAIGDIHGSAHTLDTLLDVIDFDPSRTQLWFVGDLVNRGPDSADVIRRVRDLGEQATVVLGNHDLSLLSLAYRDDARKHASESLHAVLRAPDAGELLHWLRHRPLLHRSASLSWTMVHAGIPPEWSVTEAQARASELEAALQGPHHDTFLRELFGDTPARWTPELEGIERLRYITNALTRQRFVHRDGRLNMAYKKTLAGAPADLAPWFAVPARASAGERIVFGHWSALEQVAWPEHNVWCIDTGASWGGQLSALWLDQPTPELIQVNNRHAGQSKRA